MAPRVWLELSGGEKASEILRHSYQSEEIETLESLELLIFILIKFPPTESKVSLRPSYSLPLSLVE